MPEVRVVQADSLDDLSGLHQITCERTEANPLLRRQRAGDIILNDPVEATNHRLPLIEEVGPLSIWTPVPIRRSVVDILEQALD